MERAGLRMANVKHLYPFLSRPFRLLFLTNSSHSLMKPQADPGDVRIVSRKCEQTVSFSGIRYKNFLVSPNLSFLASVSWGRLYS